MLTIPVTLTDAQATRLAQSFSYLNNNQPATPAQVLRWIMRQLKAEVLKAATSKVQQASEDAARAAIEAEGW